MCSFVYHWKNKSRSIDKPALTIQNCEKIILKPKSLEVEVKIEEDNFLVAIHILEALQSDMAEWYDI